MNASRGGSKRKRCRESQSTRDDFRVRVRVIDGIYRVQTILEAAGKCPTVAR